MSLAALPKIAANNRDAKEANIKDFVAYELAMRAGSPADATSSVYSLVARAPDSPVVRAVSSMATVIAQSGISIRVVLLDTYNAAEDHAAASLADLSTCDVRVLSDTRFTAAHEQLVLSPDRLWIGDCMRRDPAKRDAFEIYHDGDTIAAGHASASFAKLWAIAKPVTRLQTASVSTEVIVAGQAGAATQPRHSNRG